MQTIAMHQDVHCTSTPQHHIGGAIQGKRKFNGMHLLNAHVDAPKQTRLVTSFHFWMFASLFTFLSQAHE